MLFSVPQLFLALPLQELQLMDVSAELLYAKLDKPVNQQEQGGYVLKVNNVCGRTNCTDLISWIGVYWFWVPKKALIRNFMEN